MDRYDIISEAPAVLKIMAIPNFDKSEGGDVMNILLYILIGCLILYLLDKGLVWLELKRKKYPMRDYYDEDYHRDYEIKKHLFA
jgi:hypothetical protein